MVFECEALQTTREDFADLFGPAIVTMQQYMWQETLYRLHILCLNALRSLRPWVMTNRACLTCNSLPLNIYCV